MAEDEFFRRIAEVDEGSAAVSPERRPGTAALRIARGRSKEEGRASNADAELDAGNGLQESRSVDGRGGGDSRSSGRHRERWWLRPLAGATAVLVCVGVGAVGASIFGTGHQAPELSAVSTWVDAPPAPPAPARGRGAARREKQSPRGRRGGRDGRVRATSEGRRIEPEPTSVAEPGASAPPPPLPEPVDASRERFGFEERAP